MVDKKQVRRNIKQLQRIKTWQLIILLIFAGFISATFLRLNNVGMVERRTAVMSADSVGDNKATLNRLYDLQRYVTAHMNTEMGKGVYLESTYKRDAQAAYEAASVDTNPNGNIYKKVQAVCMPKFTHWTYAYLVCTADELAKYPASADLISSVKLPQADTYLHVYISPLWSPDFAGWSVLIFVAILLMIVARLTSVIVLKMMLRHHYKSI